MKNGQKIENLELALTFGVFGVRGSIFAKNFAKNMCFKKNINFRPKYFFTKKKIQNLIFDIFDFFFQLKK